MNEILKEDWVKESINPITELAGEFQVPEEIMKKKLEFEKGLKRSKKERTLL